MIGVSRIEDSFIIRMIDPDNEEEVACAAGMDKLCYENPLDACWPEEVLERIAAAPDLFMVAVDRASGRLAGVLNGIASNESDFRDEFFSEAKLLHDPDGSTVMMCGLDVMPEYRGLGLARAMMDLYWKREKERGRKRLLLTCVEEKIGMYERLGYQLLGVSASVYGGTVWYDMERVIAADRGKEKERS